jgi:hypothetical protein
VCKLARQGIITILLLNIVVARNPSMFRLLSKRSLYSHIDPKQLIITPSLHQKQKVPDANLEFGRTFTDHMLEIDWKAGEGMKHLLRIFSLIFQTNVTILISRVESSCYF